MMQLTKRQVFLALTAAIMAGVVGLAQAVNPQAAPAHRQPAGSKAGERLSKTIVKFVFASYGSRENGATARTNTDDLNKAGIKAVFYQSPLTAHEWLSWRRSLHEFAPLLFQK